MFKVRCLLLQDDADINGAGFNGLDLKDPVNVACTARLGGGGGFGFCL